MDITPQIQDDGVLLQKVAELVEQWRDNTQRKGALYSMIKKTWPILIKALQNGHSRNSAKKLAQMGDQTFQKYFNEIPEFKEVVEEAEALAIDRALQAIQNNLTDPRVAMWFLERKDREFQAPQRVDFTTKDEAIVFTFNMQPLPEEGE